MSSAPINKTTSKAKTSVAIIDGWRHQLFEQIDINYADYLERTETRAESVSRNPRRAAAKAAIAKTQLTRQLEQTHKLRRPSNFNVNDAPTGILDLMGSTRPGTSASPPTKKTKRETYVLNTEEETPENRVSPTVSPPSSAEPMNIDPEMSSPVEQHTPESPEVERTLTEIQPPSTVKKLQRSVSLESINRIETPCSNFNVDEQDPPIETLEPNTKENMVRIAVEKPVTSQLKRSEIQRSWSAECLNDRCPKVLTSTNSRPQPKTEKLRTATVPEFAAKEVEEKKRQDMLEKIKREDEARRNKEKLIEARKEEVKRAREEKLQKVAAAREQQEQLKASKQAEAERKKQERLKALMAEKEKMKELELKHKKEMNRLKAHEVEERRLKEEQARLARLKEQEEEAKRHQEAERRKLEEYEKIKARREAETAIAAKLKKAIKKPQNESKPPKTMPPAPPKPNEYEMGDDDSDFEGSTKPIPDWAQKTNENLPHITAVWAAVDQKLIKSIFGPCPKTCDLKEIFPDKCPNKPRTSSAIWDSTFSED